MDDTNDNLPPDYEEDGCRIWVEGDGYRREKNGMIIWTDKNHIIHRDNGPAIILPNGAKHYFKHGEVVDEHGNLPEGPYVIRETNSAGELHNENGPAVIYKNGIQEWRLFGELHRTDGPAVIYPDTAGEKWYKHGKLHREDGPAKTSTNGYRVNYQKWFINGQLHREGKPAVIGDNGEERWYQNGQLHREDGPALIKEDGTQVWYNKDKFIKSEPSPKNLEETQRVVTTRE